MSKKTFISLVFSSGNLSIVKLDSKQTTVEKFASIPIPQGIIKNYFVADPKSLTQLIKNALAQLKISEKTAGLVIPEFSTYIKIFSLPKLETSDLDEAVHWQIKEYLPEATEDVLFDWKKVGEDEHNVEVMAVTISKKLLSSYVDAVSAAGLYPIVVENPALSLSRITDGKNGSRLVLYKQGEEALLVVVHEEKILGSSVVSARDINSLLLTARQMSAHYATSKIEKVLIGGGPYDQAFLDGLAKSLGVVVEWANIKVSGLSAIDQQQYLLGISLQLKPADEPKSEKTINLLPEDWVKKYEKRRSSLQVRSLVFIGSLVVWLCFLVTVGMYFFINQEIRFLKQEVQFQEQALAAHEGDPLTKVEEINAVSQKTQKIIGSLVSPEKLINSINEKKPEGINITNYELVLESGQITIFGRAATREDVINFKTALEEVEEFKQVRVPITSLQQETDLNFEMSIAIEPLISKASQPAKLKL